MNTNCLLNVGSTRKIYIAANAITNTRHQKKQKGKKKGKRVGTRHKSCNDGIFVVSNDSA